MIQKPTFSLSFMPGPTKISADTYADMVEATQNHILEISHRGAEFTALSKTTVEGLRTFFNVPADYHVFFTTSATENWGLLAANLVETHAHVITNGNFSNIRSHIEAWGKQVSETVIDWGKHVDINALNIPAEAEVITVAYNETSTGVNFLPEEITQLRQQYPNQLLTVDITSNAGVQNVNITDADMWYFSVQKGMGLPSGMGVCFVSPKAFAKSEALAKSNAVQGAFTFPKMAASMADGKFQTITTPNILNMYLLCKQLERWNTNTTMAAQCQRTQQRAEQVYNFFTSLEGVEIQAADAAHKSTACLCFKAPEETVEHIMNTAKAAGIAIGTGYGKFKKTGFRIANYPALSDDDFEKLFTLFR